MKVVINTSFGGFGVSSLAIKELVMMKSDAIHSYTPKNYYGGDNEKFKDRVNWEEKFNEDFPSDYTDIGDGFMGHNWNYHIYKDGLFYDVKDNWEDRYKIRSHHDLINVIERLKEKANGSHAKLKIVNIPDGVDFEISEYDGLEHVSEKHRTWS